MTKVLYAVRIVQKFDYGTKFEPFLFCYFLQIRKSWNPRAEFTASPSIRSASGFDPTSLLESDSRRRKSHPKQVACRDARSPTQNGKKMNVKK